MIDNIFSWTTQKTYLFTACVKTVINEKFRRQEKVWKSSTRKVVNNIWPRVSTVLKENDFLSITVMVSPQQNEPHSIPKENPDNVHEADSTEKHRHEKQIPAGLLTFFY